MGLYKCERPEIEAWDFAEYRRLLASAKAHGEDWYAAVGLAGEAGLRVGEVKALRWREDVDLIARTLTVRQQTCNGVTTTPKGRTPADRPHDDDALRRAQAHVGRAGVLRGPQRRWLAEERRRGQLVDGADLPQ